jgi:hypothetical protein
VELVSHISDIDSRPLSSTVQKHEAAMANHADAPAGSEIHPAVRKSASGSWIGKIMKSLLGEGLKIGG